MPAGRKQIITEIITPNKRDLTYEKIRQEFESNKLKILYTAEYYEHWPLLFYGSAKDFPSLKIFLNRFSDLLKVSKWEIGNTIDTRLDDEICFQCFIINITRHDSYTYYFKYFSKELENFENDPKEFLQQRSINFNCFDRINEIWSQSVPRVMKILLQLGSSKPYNWNGMNYPAVAQRFLRTSDDKYLKVLRSNPLSLKEHKVYETQYHKLTNQSSEYFEEPCFAERLSKTLGKNIPMEKLLAFKTVLEYAKKYENKCQICSMALIKKFKKAERGTREALKITPDIFVYELMSDLRTRASFFLDSNEATDFIYKNIQKNWNNKSSIFYKIIQKNYKENRQLLLWQRDFKSFSPILVPYQKGTNDADCWDCLIKNRFPDHGDYKKNLQIVRNILEMANSAWKNCSPSLIAEFEKELAYFYSKISKNIGPDYDSFITKAMVDKYTSNYNKLFATFKVSNSNDYKVEEMLVDNRTDEEVCLHNFLYDRKVINLHHNQLKYHNRKLKDLTRILYHLGECGNCPNETRTKLESSKPKIIKAVNRTKELKTTKPFNWNGIDYFSVAERFIKYQNDSDLEILRGNEILYADYNSIQNELLYVFWPYNDFCWHCVIGEFLGGYSFRDAASAIYTVLYYAQKIV